MNTVVSAGLRRRTIESFVAVVVAASAVVAASIPARAIEVTAEQRQFCMGDAFKLCGSEIPDVDRVLVCMRAKKAQVSAPCRAVMPN